MKKFGMLLLLLSVGLFSVGCNKADDAGGSDADGGAAAGSGETDGAAADGETTE